jgi:hypothetical protein
VEQGDRPRSPQLAQAAGPLAGLQTRSASALPGWNADERDCTRGRRKTHVTEGAEVLYPWHPWFGRVVHVHEVIERGGEHIFRCDVDEKLSGRCLDVPAWMFDRVACLGVRRVATPQVDLAGLARLKRLFVDAAGQASTPVAVIGARHSFENRGDADAAPQSARAALPYPCLPKPN